MIFSDDLHVELNIHELIPNKCLVLDRPKGHAEWEGTEVAFDLSELNARTTILRLSHSNWIRQTDLLAASNFRWARHLDTFRVKCEQKMLLEVSIL